MKGEWRDRSRKHRFLKVFDSTLKIQWKEEKWINKNVQEEKMNISSGKMHCYAWFDGQTHPKVGEVFVYDGQDPEDRVMARIKAEADATILAESIAESRLKFRYWDASEKAKIYNKNYPKAKFDDFLRKNIEFLYQTRLGINERHTHKDMSDIDVYNRICSDLTGYFGDSGSHNKPKLTYSSGLRKKGYDDLNQILDKLPDTATCYIPLLGGYYRGVLVNLYGGAGKSALLLKNIESRILNSDRDCAFVCTSIPDTIDSFTSDLEKYGDFDELNYCIVRGDKLSIVERSPLCKWVILFTIQGVKAKDQKNEDSKTIKKVLKFIKDKKLSPKAAVFDEFHFATNTQKSKTALDQLVGKIESFSDCIVFASTATGEEYVSIFGPENSIILNEHDLNEAKKSGDTGIPKVSVNIKEIPALCKNNPEVVRLVNNNERDLTFSRDDCLTMMALFDEIIHPQNSYDRHGGTFGRQPQKKTNYGDKNGCVSILAVLDRIKQAEDLARTLDEHFPDIKLIKAYGSEPDSRLSPNDVEKKINENKKINKHTIIISCGKYTVGTNINNLSCLLLLKKCESSKWLRQFIFRLNREDAEIPEKYCFLMPSQKILYFSSTLQVDYERGIFNSEDPTVNEKIILDRCLPFYDPQSPLEDDNNLLEKFVDIVNSFKNGVFLNSNLEISSRRILERLDPLAFKGIVDRIGKGSPANYSVKDCFLTGETELQELTRKYKKKNKAKTENSKNFYETEKEKDRLLTMIDKFLECLYCVSVPYFLHNFLPETPSEVKEKIKSENYYEVFGFKLGDIDLLFSEFEISHISILTIVNNHIRHIQLSDAPAPASTPRAKCLN